MSVALWQSANISHYACILRFAAKKQICLRLIKITNAVRMDLQWFTVRHTKSRRFLEPTDYGLITLDKSGLGGKKLGDVCLLGHVFPFEILQAKEQRVFFPLVAEEGWVIFTVQFHIAVYKHTRHQRQRQETEIKQIQTALMRQALMNTNHGWN